MDSWRKVWREGIVPNLSLDALLALRRGLCENDKRLIQGSTTTPPPLQCVMDWPVECACLIGFCGWIGEGKVTVAEVEEYFAQKCIECDDYLGEPASCRFLINWWDEEPRETVFKELLSEVDLALEKKRGG